MKIREPFSVRRRLRSLIHAFDGLKILIQTQHNARVHALVSLAGFGLSWWLQIGRLKFVLIIWSILIVWIVEAFNTACEILLNIVAAKYSVKVKRAKDIAAAAVLMAAGGAVITGFLILGPPLCQRLAG